MADISSTVKKRWMRGMEAVGDAFDRLAASTRLRVAEMNLSNQRKEILDNFGQRAYQLWKDGAVLPPELEELLQKVTELEKQLAEVRAERLKSGIQDEQTPEGAAAEEIVKAAADEAAGITTKTAEAVEAVETGAAEALEAAEEITMEAAIRDETGEEQK